MPSANVNAHKLSANWIVNYFVPAIFASFAPFVFKTTTNISYLSSIVFRTLSTHSGQHIIDFQSIRFIDFQIYRVWISEHLNIWTSPNSRQKNTFSEWKQAKLPNGNAPNCRTKTRQIAERKCAKLPNKNVPNFRIK